jgi:hypothetical protein
MYVILMGTDPSHPQVMTSLNLYIVKIVCENQNGSNGV